MGPTGSSVSIADYCNATKRKPPRWAALSLLSQLRPVANPWVPSSGRLLYFGSFLISRPAATDTELPVMQSEAHRLVSE